MHVVHVTFSFDPAKDAAAFLETIPALTALCEETARHPGVRVTSLCRFDRDEDVERNGVAYRFRADDPGERVAGPRTVPARIFALARSLRPDVVHVHGLIFPSQIAALRLWVGRGPLLVVQHHGERPGGRIPARLQRALLRAADGFLFTSPAIAEEWRRAGVLAPSWPVLGVVEASTDLAPVPRARAREEAGLPGAPALLWVGRLHQKKDPRTTLEGFARALERLPHAHLTMAFGEAPLLREVRAFLERTPLLASRVHLLGRVPHERLATLFSAADLFVTSSPAEGSNFALIEALACGTPPVATDIPAHRAVTGGGAVGALFDVGDAAACARALVDASSRPPDEARSAARRHFEERLSWPVVADGVVAAYDSLAAAKGAGTRGPRRREDVGAWVSSRR